MEAKFTLDKNITIIASKINYSLGFKDIRY
jgi:hypothetical protein